MILVAVVPAYNEAEKIGATIAGLRAVDSSLQGRDIKLRIFVVNDGSGDDTADLAREAGADRVVHHHTNRGLGAAVRSGLNAARDEGADLVVKFDADLQHDPTEILELLQPILDDEADIVYGDRFKGLQYRMPIIRRAGNMVFTWLMRRLTKWDVRDGQPGIFAISSAYLDRFSLPGDYNYTQQILLDAYHKGMRFAHVPVTFRKRTSGRSFVSLKYPFKVLSQVVMVLVGLKPLRVFGLTGLAFLGVGAGLFAWDLAHFFMGANPKPADHVNAILGFSLFGVQTAFFGILAQLIIYQNTR